MRCYCLLLPSLICLVVFTSTTYAVTVHVPDDFATIQAALDSCASGDTVIVRDGTYTGDGNRDIDFLGKAIVLMSENGPEVTIIDCEGAGRGFNIGRGEDSSTVVNGFTITNGYAMYGGGIHCAGSSPTITSNTIEGNSAGWGAGICCSANSSPTIVDNNILGNTAAWPPGMGMGGGIYIYQASSPTITGNIIAENNVQDSGAGISCWEASATIRSNVISGNTAPYYSGGIDISYSSSVIISGNIIENNSASGIGGGGISFWHASATMNNNTMVENNSLEGGGIGIMDECEVTATNMIFWNNSATTGDEIWMGYSNSSIPSSLTISYSDVEGGQDSVFVDTGCTLNWGDGMIDTDPLFRDPSADDFHLMATACGDSLDSPCIDAGHPDSVDVTLDCEHGLGSERADMGAFGGRGTPPTSITESQPRETIRIPRSINLFQNYPNPFNPSTTIGFDLPVTSGLKQSVSLTIYDLRGRCVRTLIDSELDPGNHKIHWNGRDDRGQSVASGIYLYRLKTGDETFTRKMTVLK